MSDYPEVDWFAGRMRKKLRANAHKGGWANEPTGRVHGS